MSPSLHGGKQQKKQVCILHRYMHNTISIDSIDHCTYILNGPTAVYTRLGCATGILLQRQQKVEYAQTGVP